MTLLDGDILYNQSDQANEIFFIFGGGILLSADLSDEIEMDTILQHD